MAKDQTCYNFNGFVETNKQPSKYIMIQPQIPNIYIKITIHFYDKFGNNNDY
jgi:hypothetical protein